MFSVPTKARCLASCRKPLLREGVRDAESLLGLVGVAVPETLCVCVWQGSDVLCSDIHGVFCKIKN